MRIITRGQAPEKTPVQATCSQCRTVFEFLPHEARLGGNQMDGPHYIIGCPECGTPVYRDLPENR
jgi:RNase P subunit RPR2